MAPAEAEYLEAVSYYTDQSVAAATAFIDKFWEATQLIRERPFAWTEIDKDVRRFVLRKFPYGVLYHVPGEHEIVIFAVMQLNREPLYWRERIKQLKSEDT